MPKLRQWREFRALSQEELADKAGVSLRSVAGYEAGAGARPATVRKLASALDVEVAELFEDARHPKGLAPSPKPVSVAARPDSEKSVDYEKLYLEKLREHLDLIGEIIEDAAEIMGTEVYEEFIELPSEEQHRRITLAEKLLKLAHERLELTRERLNDLDGDLPEEVEEKVVELRARVEQRLEQLKKSA